MNGEWFDLDDEWMHVEEEDTLSDEEMDRLAQKEFLEIMDSERYGAWMGQ